MLLAVLNDLLSLLVGLIIAGSALAWYRAWRRVRRGAPLLPLEARQLVPWGLADLGLMVIAGTVIQVGAQLIVRRTWDFPAQFEMDELTPHQWSVFLVSTSCAALLTLVVVAWLLRVRVGVSVTDLGIDWTRVRSDLGLGMAAFAMLAVPVFALQLVLIKYWQPTTHPLVVMIQNERDPRLLTVAAFAAVITAPIVEEYLFRVFLQGWLENAVSILFGRRSVSEEAVAVGRQLLVFGRVEQSPDVDSSSATAISQVDPVPWPSGTAAHRPPADGQSRPTDRSSWWPIGLSAAVFALAHLGHGPDPIPLFFLALGLGYLYHRTHRVLPCVVVHFLVNGFTMLQLLVLIQDAA